MREPSPRTSRLAIAASLAAALLIGGGGVLLGRAMTPAPPPAAVPVPAPAPAPVEPPVVEAPVERMLRRADLIALGIAAADAMTTGIALPDDMLERAGQKFELFLPFGCDGPAAPGSDAPLRWRFDEKSSVLRVHIAPTVWTTQNDWRDPSETIEALEGFWIERSWSSRETCPPPVAPAPEAIVRPAQTLGVVQLIYADTPRQIRRDGKPYEAVLRIEPDDADLRQGLRIRLTGRIGRFPDDRPVRCRQPAGPAQRPVCLIAVRVDEVAVQNPVTGETLSTWQSVFDAAGPAGTDPQ